MSFLHLSNDLIMADIPSWKGCSEQRFNVVTTEQWKILLVAFAFLGHEQHCHGHQRHVVMPGTPLPGLIIRHPGFTFSILKGTFHPEPLPLHLGQLVCTGRFGGVRERVLQGLGGIRFSAHNQVPVPRLGLFFIP